MKRFALIVLVSALCAGSMIGGIWFGRNTGVFPGLTCADMAVVAQKTPEEVKIPLAEWDGIIFVTDKDRFTRRRELIRLEGTELLDTDGHSIGTARKEKMLTGEKWMEPAPEK